MGSRRANGASQQQELYCTLGWPCPGEQFPKQHPPSGPFESRRLPLCGTPTATGSRVRPGPVIDTRIASPPRHPGISDGLAHTAQCTMSLSASNVACAPPCRQVPSVLRSIPSAQHSLPTAATRSQKTPEPAQQSREIPSRVWGTPQQIRLGRRHRHRYTVLSHALCLHEAGPKSTLIAYTTNMSGYLDLLPAE
jgi:hypothetical protein